MKYIDDKFTCKINFIFNLTIIYYNDRFYCILITKNKSQRIFLNSHKLNAVINQLFRDFFTKRLMTMYEN